MSNWFEKNPTPSIILYTLAIVGATWAASTFILEDNRLNALRSELGAEQALSEQFKAKIEILERDNGILRAQNDNYLEWLGRLPGALPAIQPRLLEYKIKIKSLEKELLDARTLVRGQPLPVTTGTAEIGTAFIDQTTGVIATLVEVTPENTGIMRIKFPESKAAITEEVYPGSQFQFSFQDQGYILTVVSVIWIGNYADITITAQN